MSHLNSVRRTCPIMLDQLNVTILCVSCIYQYVCVHVNPDQMMMFGGTSEPVALCALGSIGRLGPAENKKYSKLLCGLLNKHLGVSPER